MNTSTRHNFTVSFRVVFAALALGSVVEQYLLDIHLQGTSFNGVNYFSFFTIDSNLLAAAAFALAGYFKASGARWPHWLDFFRGATVVYLAVTAIVNLVILGGLQAPLALIASWPSNLQHVYFPIAVAADWIYYKPQTSISWQHSMAWLGFPALWLIYTLARGASTRWYPYFFLDPTNGYFRVSLYCFVILILMASLGLVVRSVGKIL